MQSKSHTLNIRAVPQEAWLRAKHNALESNLPFREYIIRLLLESRPVKPQPDERPIQWRDLISD